MEEKNLEDIIGSIPEDIRTEVLQIVSRVLEIENSKLHMGNPRYINEEIIEALEETVR